MSSDSARDPGASPLAGLLAHIAGRRLAVDPDSAPGRDYPELAALDEFRETWTRLNTDFQLRQSLAQVPENAGPLNSSHLMRRALLLMRKVSPGYMRHFLAHADALSSMEQLHDATGMAKSAPRAAARKSPRGKPR